MSKNQKPPERFIQPVVAIISIHDQRSDFTYWQAQSYLDRLTALEDIRTEYHQWRYGYEPGL